MLLTDPEILKTKVADDTSDGPTIPVIESPPPRTNTLSTSPRTDASFTNASGFSFTSLETIDTELVPSPWVDLTDMNFEKGLAGEFTIDIMQHMVRNKKVNENLNTKYENGRTTRCQIDKQRRLTGGSLFDANHIVMDEEVLRIRESKEQDKMDEKEATVSKAIAKYHVLKEAYLKVINSGTEEKKFKGTHFKAVINFKKRKNDKSVPTRVADLKVRHEEVKNRSEWSLKEFLTDRDFCNEGEEYLVIVERLIPRVREAMPPLAPVRIEQLNEVAMPPLAPVDVTHVEGVAMEALAPACIGQSEGSETSPAPGRIIRSDSVAMAPEIACGGQSEGVAMAQVELVCNGQSEAVAPAFIG